MRAAGDRSATGRRSRGWAVLTISLLTAFLTSLFIGAAAASAAAPNIVSGAPPQATMSQPYFHQYAAIGDVDFSFVVSSGELPPGINLGSNGALTGTPSVPGSYTFSVVAYGPTGASYPRTDTVVVGGDAATLSLQPLPPAEGFYSLSKRAVSWSGALAMRNAALPVFGGNRSTPLFPARAPWYDFGSSFGC
jgi:hypothetical protein